ncbi:GH92 family glycosyl hydrolase [Kitasatospora viridis]|nr:GH92 family glycosyl hydrolase [Kitasatospora viridis]
MRTRHRILRLLRPAALAAGLLLMVGGTVAAPPTAAAAAIAPTTVTDPAQYVNPFVGTQKSTNFGSSLDGGHTFPGASAPLGMVQWSPDTVGGGGGASYDYTSNQIRGFSLNHLSGAGCDIFGNFPFMPMLGSTPGGPAGFSHTNEAASPGTYSVTFDNGITTNLAATQRAGIAQFSYPAGQTASLTVDAGTALNAGYSGNSGSLTLGSNRISGSSSSGGFCGTGSEKYTVYFSAIFDRNFSSSSLLNNNQQALVSFDTSTNPTVTVRVGLSFVSADNAYANMNAEVGGNSLDTVKAGTRAAWNTDLSRIAVGGGSLPDTRTFYTALYHSLLAPNVFSDTDGRYPGFDGQIHTAATGHAQYANFSGWDVYRSQVQLLALLCPQEASDIGQSIVNQGNQAGYFDRWTVANSADGVMDGDPMPIIGSSLYAFGATQFDVWGLLWKAWGGTVNENERPFQGEYLGQGYVSTDAGWSASATLEYATSDFATAQLAGRLGDTDMHDTELHRSTNWRNLFNFQSGYLQPRAADHSWPSFTPTAGDGFAESDGAQNVWAVPQNLHGLITAMGGNGKAVGQLDSFFGQLNAGTNSSYAYLGNEPSLGTPWVYDYAGRPDRTQAVVRQALTQLYSDAPTGEPGNDDLGEMSSWAVWSALGMYPETPGRAELALASPLFPSISITRENGVVINISAPGAADNTPYVSGLTVNGAASTHPWLGEDFVANGGTLQYTLSSTANPQWGSATTDAPPSFDVGPSTPATGTITGPGSKCLDDSASSVADGNKIQIWDCNGTAAQQWTLAPDGTVQVLGHCLDVFGSGSASGTQVQLFTCNGTGAQQWWPKADGTLVNTPSNLCLDLPNGNTTNGQQLQIFTCNGTSSQKWTVP